jgi:hypothetical protein
MFRSWYISDALWIQEKEVPAVPEMGAGELPHIIDHTALDGCARCLLRLQGLIISNLDIWKLRIMILPMVISCLSFVAY